MDEQTKQDEVADLGDFVNDGRMTFEVDGSPFVFRVPDFEDLVELEEVLPIYPGAKPGETIRTALDRLGNAEMVEHFRRCSRLLVQVSVRPRLVIDDDPPEGASSVRSLPGGLRSAIASALMAAAGRTSEASFRIRPTSGDRSSSSSTLSPADTDAPPASSSSATHAGGSTAGSE